MEVIRDEFGTPHIFGKTPEEVAYGVGYAQAEDRLQALLNNLARGSDEVAPPDPANSLVDRMLVAFADGVNRYITDHKKDLPEPVEPVRPEQVRAFSQLAFDWIQGSNDVLVSGSRTPSGAPEAILDPLGDWNADDRPYPMRINIEGEEGAGPIEASGIAPAGVPFPLIGHTRHAAYGWGKIEEAGPQTLEQAWGMLTARNRSEMDAVLGMQQIHGEALVAMSSVGDAGEIHAEMWDTGGSTPFLGFLMRPRYRRDGTWSRQADGGTRELLRSQNSWPLGRLVDVAFAGDVHGAKEWQKAIARIVPDDKLTLTLTGWDRRADVGSVQAREFYMFKMELGRESSMMRPPDSLSRGRMVAAMRRVWDYMGSRTKYTAPYGSEFRVVRDRARESYPVGGGMVTEAGIETPRAIWFEHRGTLNMGVGGQTAPQIIELGPEPRSYAVLSTGQSDDPDSPHFDDQARDLFSIAAASDTFFGNRELLMEHASSQLELKY